MCTFVGFLHRFVLVQFNLHLKSDHGRYFGIGCSSADGFISSAEPCSFGDAKTGRKSIGTAGVVSSPRWSTPFEAKAKEVQKEPMNARSDLLALSLIAFTLLITPAWAAGQQAASPSQDGGQAAGYALGPGDTLFILVQNVDELSSPTAVFRIDLNGYVDVPRIGPVYASGLTTERLDAVLVDRFRKYLQNPVVSVRVDEFHSKPISVLGAVGTPGVHNLQGDKTLLAAISEAGGLTKDAGNTINITRRKDEGPIPLPTAVPDATGQFSVAQVNVRDVIDATNPKENILVRPNDVITVPQGDVVYVIGAVNKAGGFTLSDHQDLSVLEALSLASGLDKEASASKSKVLRKTGAGSSGRTEIPVNVKKILEGKASDFPLLPNDILFIPTSGSKNASIKVLQALLNGWDGHSDLRTSVLEIKVDHLSPIKALKLRPQDQGIEADFTPLPSRNSGYLDGGEEAGVLEYLRILRRRKGTIVLTAFLGLVAAILIGLPLTPTYRAEGTLEIQDVNSDYMHQKQLNPVDNGDDSDMQTQVLILESDALFDRVEKKLNATYKNVVFPWREGLRWAISAKLAKMQNMPQPEPEPLVSPANLRVRAVGPTHIVDVTFDSPDPQLAADTVNTLSSEYIESNMEARWKMSGTNGAMAHTAAAGHAHTTRALRSGAPRVRAARGIGIHFRS